MLIELLKENEQLRRSDIFEAAKAKGLTVSDTLYSKVSSPASPHQPDFEQSCAVPPRAPTPSFDAR